MTRIERLVGIMLVLQHRRTVPVLDLARRFDVSRRTIYRDLVALADAGFPVANLGKGYGVPENYRLPQLTFAPEEVVALLMGADFVRAHTDSALRAAADAAILKIEASLPHATLSHARKLTARILLRSPRQPPRRGRDERLSTLQKAIADHHAMEIRYAPAGETSASELVIEPLGMVFSADHWHVIAHCRLGKRLRAFRADRISDLRSLDETFVPPKTFTLDPDLLVDDQESRGLHV